MVLLTPAVATSLPPNLNSKNSHPKPTQLIYLLKQCKTLAHFPPVHSLIVKTGNQQHPLLLAHSLRLLSVFHSSHYYVLRIFATIETPNIYHFTSLINFLTHVVCSHHEAIRLYSQMLIRSISPDPIVVSSVLKACSILLALIEGKQIHAHVFKLAFGSQRLVRIRLVELYSKCSRFEEAQLVFDEMPDRDSVTATILINSYSECGRVDDAMNVFEVARDRDTVCWTAMIDGCVRNGRNNEALELFREMQKEGIAGPNEVTVVCVLSACAQLGALELGRWVDSYIDKHRIRRNTFVASALIDMYSKCGSVEEASEVFDGMLDRDVISYNSMITGFSLHGRSKEAVELYLQLVKEGLRPTHITFVGILNACSHGGLVDLGFEIFYSMTKEYGLEPKIEHYGCIVDLLGRVGCLEEAYEFVLRMRIKPDEVIWGALLGACKLHGNLTLGKKIAETLIESKDANSGTYVLLSNVYALLGKWEEAVWVRGEMKSRGIQKEPGCSSIEVDNEIHEFLLGDIRHPRRDEIYGKLETLSGVLKREGYCPKKDVVLHDIEEGDKEWALRIHSERLAICYGLIATGQGRTIRVVKNLRVCNDCHEMIKMVSRVERRKIVVRDRNRFHHFEDGVCSCGDYW